MFRAIVLAAALSLPLAACGSPSSPANEATENATGGNAIAAMDKLNENERNVALFRAISDAGRDCQGVTRSVATDPIQGRPAWIATCESGRPWVVSLAADGTATVIEPNLKR